MKTVTNGYKNNVKMFGRELDSKISYNLDGYRIELGATQLNSITPHYEGGILKSVMKQLDIDSNEDIPIGTTLNYQFGVKVGSEYEYIDYGNYIVYSSEKQEDVNSYKLVCYDSMLYAMKDYDNTGITYPITIRNYISEICTKLGLTFKQASDTFPNYDKEIAEELYLDTDGNSLGYTFRDVLDELAEVTASTICINETDDELELRYIEQDTTTVETLIKDMENGTDVSGMSFVFDTTGYTSQQLTDGIDVDDLEAPVGFVNSDQTKAQIVAFIGGLIFNYILPEFQLDVYKPDGTLFGEINDEHIYTAYIGVDTTTEMWESIYILNDLTLNESYGDMSAIPNGYTLECYFDMLPNSVLWNCMKLTETTSGAVTINEQYLKDVNVNFKEKFGPVNSIVLSRAGGADNVYLQDEDSVEENGLCEIKIEDNQIMNGNDRADYLPDILEQLDGLEYYANDFSSTGITFLELCDMYNVQIGENTYNCIMFNDETNITQGLEELIYTDIPEETETEYKHASKDDRKINQTYIIARKNEGEIELLTSETTTLRDQMRNTYTIEQVNSLIQTAESGLTNTFSESGGNNIFRNTGLWFLSNDNSNPYEFWEGTVERIKEDKASNMNAMSLQNGYLTQEQTVPNGKYTISFKFNKLIPATIAKVFINDIEYELAEAQNVEYTEFSQTIEVSSQHINIKFYCNTNGGWEIYDLMVNAGEVKLAYTQNQNETTTDTVNISKGITITSTDTNTTFKAQSDGIRVFNSKDMNNPVTEFLDTGMETDEAVIKRKSQIVGTLWQEVNGQTWITRL